MDMLAAVARDLLWGTPAALPALIVGAWDAYRARRARGTHRTEGTGR